MEMERFRYEENGYNREEVNKFVESVITQTEDIIRRCKYQQQEIEGLKKELARCRKIEASLDDSLKKEKEASAELRNIARKEADMIITDAKYNASRIVNESLLQAEKIEMKKEIIENNLKIVKRKLKLITEQQKAIVEEIEVLDLDGNS